MTLVHLIAATIAFDALGSAAQAQSESQPTPVVERPFVTPAPGGQSQARPDGPQAVRRMAAPSPPRRTGERADIEIELIEGVPVIAATVNGRGPYRFIVDTGAAGYLVVKPSLAAALNLRQIGEAMSGDPSGANLRRVPLYNAESVRFGGFTFSGVLTTAIDLPNPRLASLDGIVGIRFFQDLLLTIDFGRRQLTAAPGSLPAANGREIVDVTLDRGALITLPLRVGRDVHSVHLDTGNSRFPFFMPADAIAALPTSGTARSIGAARTVSQEIHLQAIDLAAPVSIGTIRLPAVAAVAYPSVAPVGNIGSQALRNMVVTLDYANRRLRIGPSAG